ncbi:MAG: hypothetical protein CTY30_10985, partial [Methylocystis sp.]
MVAGKQRGGREALECEAEVVGRVPRRMQRHECVIDALDAVAVADHDVGREIGKHELGAGGCRVVAATHERGRAAETGRLRACRGP